GGSGVAGRLGEGQLQAGGEAAGEAFELGEQGRARVSLHAHGGVAAGLVRLPIDDVEPVLPFVQPHLEVGYLGGVVEVDGAPLDVEDAVGRGAAGRREDAPT